METLQKAFNYCAQDGDHAPLVVDLGGKCWTVMATKRPTESETTDSVPMALPSCVEGVSIRRANVTVTDGTLNLPDCALHCCAGNITLQGVHVVGRGPAPSLFTHSQVRHGSTNCYLTLIGYNWSFQWYDVQCRRGSLLNPLLTSRW